MYNLGHTRSSHKRDHLLQTPDTFIRMPLPGLENGAAVVHAAPALGASFTQYTVEFDTAGKLASNTLQRFAYVMNGVAHLSVGSEQHQLTRGSFAFLPAGATHTITAEEKTVIAVIEKPYEQLSDIAGPKIVVGHEGSVASAALLGDEDLQVRRLLPDDLSFDFAVNTMTYQPGAALAMVEVHVMEHGLLMLEGGGIYRLSDDWYPVAAGDFIWMAPYCPQWFAAIGKQPAKYLIYKDANRHPIA